MPPISMTAQQRGLLLGGELTAERLAFDLRPRDSGVRPSGHGRFSRYARSSGGGLDPGP
jgi:hypothetical protein